MSIAVTEEILCVRCSQHMKTCCQTCDIYCTSGDTARISAYTGQRDFTEFRQPTDAAYRAQDDDPLWRDRVFRPDGSRRVLKKQANGDCTFLSPKGCVLPLETRPLVCRIYPLDYNADGIEDELAPDCPTELLQSGVSLLRALDMNRADAARWHGMLYSELEQEPDRQAS